MTVVQRKLTRVPRWDPANLEHLVEAVDPIFLPYNRYHRRMTFLDQGSTPACTGFSETTAISFPPRSLKDGKPLNDFAARAYEWAKRDDDWPGEDYEGSSLLGAARGLKQFGFIEKYEWMVTPEAILMGLLKKPVVVGIPWLLGMFKPDDKGILHCTGPEEGGHAICIGAFRGFGEWLRLDNTWGVNWGKRGSAWIHKADLMGLLASSGNECLQLTRAVPLPSLDQLPE